LRVHSFPSAPASRAGKPAGSSSSTATHRPPFHARVVSTSTNGRRSLPRVVSAHSNPAARDPNEAPLNPLSRIVHQLALAVDLQQQQFFRNLVSCASRHAVELRPQLGRAELNIAVRNMSPIQSIAPSALVVKWILKSNSRVCKIASILGPLRLLTQNFDEITCAKHGPTTSVQMTGTVQNINYFIGTRSL
jgi:hypothetical protein